MVRIKYNHGVGKVGCIAALFIMFAALLFAVHAPVLADTVSWLSDIPPSFAIDEAQKPPQAPATCVPDKIYLGHDIGRSDVCIIDRGGWRYGTYTYYAPGTAYWENGYAIGFGYDAKMYRLGGISNIVPIQHSNAMVYKTTDLGFHYILNIVRDFPTKLTRWINPDPGSLATEYHFQQEPDLVLRHPDGTALKVGAVGASPNGKWLAAELPQAGVVLVNLETLDVKKISSLAGTYWHGANPSIEFAVSNDGRHVALMGHNSPSAVIENTDTCGDPIANEPDETTRMANPCAEFDLYTYLSNRLDHFTYGYYPSFDEGGGQLKFLAGQNNTSVSWVTVTIAGYNSPAQLDYLALGDSYSSGEGDTEINQFTKQKYYLPHTDTEGTAVVPEEMCHLSSRSYPFILKDAMDIPAYRMKSIACSGAVGRLDYTQSNDGYDGQNDRLGVLNDAKAIEQHKTAALNEFIPGRNQQIEFVKKYQPKAITLTAGGNDVNFGGVAFACAPPNISSSGSFSCDYASTTIGRARLGSAIAKQYGNLTQLYVRLHETSPNTKIYVVGYPQFFSDSGLLPCAANVAFDKSERTMAREAVIYLNDVIEAAAQTAGVKYINIENSLGYHTLCGGEESYVTGLARSGKLTTNIPDLFSHESFHPNAKGHKVIAGSIQDAIGGKTFTEYSNCSDRSQIICPIDAATAPQPTPYFADAMAADPANYTPATMVKKTLQKGKDAFTLSLTDLEPGSFVNIKIFSDPTDLGTRAVDDQGRLNVSIPVPSDLPAGFHTLEVEAKTFSGEPITFWQIVEVHGPGGDLDEDGIPDSNQKCLLVPAAGVDRDTDGTDDGCDPEIGAAPIEITTSPLPVSDRSGADGKTLNSTVPLSAQPDDEEHRQVTPVDQLVRPLGLNPETIQRQNDVGAAYENDASGPSSGRQAPVPSGLLPLSKSKTKPAAYSLVSLYTIITGIVMSLLVGLWIVRRLNKR